jgi:NAD(P)-dependent dehydrogenase (short-subunit alcohol dehydrogenase family)
VELPGTVAIVTGAARGIGSGIALALARAGSDVAIADRLADPQVAKEADETAAAVRAQGRRALLVDCDVSREVACEAMVAETLAELGGLDVVVCNAGIAGIGKVEDTSTELWERVLAVNTTGTFRSRGCAGAVGVPRTRRASSPWSASPRRSRQRLRGAACGSTVCVRRACAAR